jgi:hypothetical protein
MKVTRIERIEVVMPYDERIVEALHKGGLANRATDEEFAAESAAFPQGDARTATAHGADDRVPGPQRRRTDRPG